MFGLRISTAFIRKIYKQIGSAIIWNSKIKKLNSISMQCIRGRYNIDKLPSINLLNSIFSLLFYSLFTLQFFRGVKNCCIFELQVYVWYIKLSVILSKNWKIFVQCYVRKWFFFLSCLTQGGWERLNYEDNMYTVLYTERTSFIIRLTMIDLPFWHVMDVVVSRSRLWLHKFKFVHRWLRNGWIIVE